MGWGRVLKLEYRIWNLEFGIWNLEFGILKRLPVVGSFLSKVNCQKLKVEMYTRQDSPPKADAPMRRRTYNLLVFDCSLYTRQDSNLQPSGPKPDTLSS